MRQPERVEADQTIAVDDPPGDLGHILGELPVEFGTERLGEALVGQPPHQPGRQHRHQHQAEAQATAKPSHLSSLSHQPPTICVRWAEVGLTLRTTHAALTDEPLFGNDFDQYLGAGIGQVGALLSLNAGRPAVRQ
ncbi:hypothetical protein [uncultured Meiothermus sp.]|uniref:hypothetical protein n=1 Tax=uncultured Meiothermus sp. TaxID=157471 RepID=UPI002617D14A|nr:hypothetical protein [uncultured Meiothermus sp.]